MLKNPIRRQQNGFTLIEVMIVLAIAGLILLVVFLAVPALQRNARNTTRREDAGNILAAVSEYVANNNGSLPTGVAGTGADLTIGSSGNTVPVKMGYYTYSATNITVAAQGTYGTTNNTTVDTIAIVTAASCNANTNNPAAGSSRSVVILYTVEPSAKQCRQS